MRAGRGWRRLIRERALVTLVDRAQLTGVVWDTNGLLVLRDATLLADVGGEALKSPARLDGEVIIDLARIDWVQVAAPTG